jgi:hypothetical protein
MARRAKSSFQASHLLGIFAVLGLMAFGGYALLHRSSDGGSSGAGTDLSLQEYMENSNALSGNTYRVVGMIVERIDNGGSGSGRLFNVLVEDGRETAPLGVLVPDKFNSTNIQRGQRFSFKVRVRSDGCLEAESVSKS